MSQLEVDKIVPQSGTTLTIGDSGDTITISAGATLSGSLNADNLDSGTVPSARVSGAYTGITQTGNLSSLNVDAGAIVGSIGITLDNGTVSTSKDSASARTHFAMYNTTGQVARLDTLNDDLFLRFDDNLAFTSIAGSEYMRIDSSGHAIIPAGVTLGTSAGTYNASNTLDDYEEGTWTPEYEPATGDPFTSISYGFRHATYTKVGRQVTCLFAMRTSALTKGTASGVLYLTGLPFTVGSTQNLRTYTPVGIGADWLVNNPSNLRGNHTLSSALIQKISITQAYKFQI
jgi:hypothetical protein